MSEDTPQYELSPEGQAAIEAVDGYLERAIREGRPIEALVATKQLGEITNARAKQAAREATEGSWSWTDVGQALGVTKQAAHEKLRARIGEKLDRKLSKLEQAEQAGHAKIARRAARGREKLDRRAAPETEAASQRLSEWERRQHEKLTRDMQKARDELARAEQKVRDELGEKGSAE
jgi:DNA anti-recombination protein RmuC